MGESQLDARLGLGRLPILGATLQQDPGQLFSRRVRKPQGTDFMAGGVVLRAQLLCDLQAGVTVFLEEAEEIIAFHEVDLAWVHGFRPQLVGFTGHRGAQAQTSPGSAILRIKVLPSEEQIDSFTRPLQRTKIPRGAWPSTKRTAPLGYAVAYLMVSNDCSAAGGRSQKTCSARILHVRQLSMMSKPYGVSTTTPVTFHRVSVFHGQNARRCDYRAETADAALIPRRAPARVRAVTCPGDLKNHREGS